MLGRVQLSGHLDLMTSAQQELVAEAVATYKQIRADLADAVPFWPLGLPEWADDWLAVGMRAANATYIVVWRRESSGPVAAENTISLPIAPRKTEARPRVLYPQDGALLDWNSAAGELHVSLPRCPSACLVAFDAALPTRG